MQAEHSLEPWLSVLDVCLAALEKKQRYFSKAARPNSERRAWVRGAHPAHASRPQIRPHPLKGRRARGGHETTFLLGPRERVGSGDETMAGVWGRDCGRGLVWPGSRVAGVCLAFCVSSCCRGLVCRGFLCVGGLYGQSVVRPSGGGRFQRAPVIKSFVSSGLHATFLG